MTSYIVISSPTVTPHSLVSALLSVVADILIDINGHIKLTDFGLSYAGLVERTATTVGAGKDDFSKSTKRKMNRHNSSGDRLDISSESLSLDDTTKPRTALYSDVGTPDYVAPEVLLGIGHSFPVDW